jgi:hypothetical protein
MELWKFAPQSIRIKGLASTLAERYRNMDYLKKCWVICESSFMTPQTESTQALYYKYFLIMSIFVCDFACYVKLADSPVKLKLHNEFFKMTISQMPDPELRNDAIKTIELFGRAIKNTDDEKQLHVKISNVFCSLVDRSHDGYLQTAVNAISASVYYDVTNMLEELINIGHLKI